MILGGSDKIEVLHCREVGSTLLFVLYLFLNDLKNEHVEALQIQYKI